MDIEKLLGLKKNNAEDESIPEFLTRPSDDTPGLIQDKDALTKAFIEKYKAQPLPELADDSEVEMEQDQKVDPSKSIDASKYLDLVKKTASPQQEPQAQTTTPILSDKDKIDYVAQMLNAQHAENEKGLGAALGKAATLAGYSIAGVQAPKEAYEGFNTGKNLVQDVHTQAQMVEHQRNSDLRQAMSDPNSEMSKKARELLAQAGVSGIPDTISIEQLDKMGLNISNLMTQKNAHDLKRELAESKLESQKELAALKGSKEKENKNEIIKALKEMDEMKASSRSGIGREVNRLNQGTHVMGILSHYKNLDEVPTAIKKEVAVGLATMVSPGLPHEATIKDMDQKTLQEYIGHYASALTGKPYGAGAGGSIDLLKKSLENQMGISRDLLQKHQKQFLQGYKETMPSESYGKLENIIKSKALFNTQESEQLSDEDKAAVDWANANKDDPRAQQILKLHGL